MGNFVSRLWNELVQLGFGLNLRLNSKLELKSESEPEPEPEHEPELELKSEPEPEPELELKFEPEPEPEPKLKSELEWMAEHGLDWDPELDLGDWKPNITLVLKPLPLPLSESKYEPVPLSRSQAQQIVQDITAGVARRFRDQFEKMCTADPDSLFDELNAIEDGDVDTIMEVLFLRRMHNLTYDFVRESIPCAHQDPKVSIDNLIRYIERQIYPRCKSKIQEEQPRLAEVMTWLSLNKLDASVFQNNGNKKSKKSKKNKKNKKNKKIKSESGQAESEYPIPPMIYNLGPFTGTAEQRGMQCVTRFILRHIVDAVRIDLPPDDGSLTTREILTSYRVI